MTQQYQKLGNKLQKFSNLSKLLEIAEAIEKNEEKDTSMDSEIEEYPTTKYQDTVSQKQQRLTTPSLKKEPSRPRNLTWFQP